MTLSAVTDTIPDPEGSPIHGAAEKFGEYNYGFN
jgi:hypothetical protein